MTQDNGMDVSPSWQELKEERDALAAIVQEMRGLAEDDPGFCEHIGRDLVEKLSAQPSLDRLIAEKQAESLEALCPKLIFKVDQQITRHTARLTRGRGHDN